MKKTIYILLVTIGWGLFSKAQNRVFNIEEHGAIGDGKTLNTKAIQQTIDFAASKGGGTVLVPSGKFLTGAISLKSNINLHVAEGGALLGSEKILDYQQRRPRSLIYAKDQKNISITGKGVIDGSGRAYMKDLFVRLKEGSIQDSEWTIKRPGVTRGNLIYLEHCDQISYKNITLKDPTDWVQHATNCSNFIVDSVTVDAVAYWNNDGLDFDNCRNVRITNCKLNCSDDAICLKSGDRNGICENFYIDNCTLRSSANALKFGTAGQGGFKNIKVKNLTVYDTYRSAIALEAVDGGILEDVDIRNVKATNTGNAIFIKLGHRNTDEQFSTIKNIRISNVDVQVPKSKPDKGYEYEAPVLRYPYGYRPKPGVIESISPQNHSSLDQNVTLYPHNIFPSSITGLPGHDVENIHLENIRIRYQGGASKSVAYMPLDSLHMITEAAANYPEFSMFGELPAWGFYVRHVKGLSMKNIQISYDEDDFRTAMVFDDAKQLQLDQVEIPKAIGMPVILLSRSDDASLKHIKIPVDAQKGIQKK